MIVCKHGNRTGTIFGTTVSSKSADRRAKHLRAPFTAQIESRVQIHLP